MMDSTYSQYNHGSSDQDEVPAANRYIVTIVVVGIIIATCIVALFDMANETKLTSCSPAIFETIEPNYYVRDMAIEHADGRNIDHVVEDIRGFNGLSQIDLMNLSSGKRIEIPCVSD